MPDEEKRTPPPVLDAEREGPRDECGVFGVFGHERAAELTFAGLYALQHRGQESAGIVSAGSPGNPFKFHRGMGLVSQIFTEETLNRLSGERCIGHVRYSTTGSSNIKNAQPIVVDCSLGQVAVGHNGNLVNANELRDELEADGSIFQTTCDSEVILHLMAQPSEGNRERSLLRALNRVKGAYSLVILGETEMIGVRDAQGFRPLSIGKVEDRYVLSSETCAFDLINAEFVRDVEPGEIVIIDDNGLRSVRLNEYGDSAKKSFCIFEYVYFARPDSVISRRTVSTVRTNMGRELARLHPVEADLVVPIPDSGNYAAMGYSAESGIPFEQAYVRNHYVGRTFLQPTQLLRDFGVKVKLNLIKHTVKGKRVIVVDDSIVRGTTMRTRVGALRDAGAREVHIRISCPPHKFACHYGIDFPDPNVLIANQHDDDSGIAAYLGVDSLGYLDNDSMVRATGLPKAGFCMACFDGKYPITYDDSVDKLILEKRRGRAHTLVGYSDQPSLFDSSVHPVTTSNGEHH